jgi:hypothetical protein
MNEDLENRADMNTGKKWSQMDLLDLANCIRLNDPVEGVSSANPTQSVRRRHD